MKWERSLWYSEFGPYQLVSQQKFSMPQWAEHPGILTQNVRCPSFDILGNTHDFILSWKFYQLGCTAAKTPKERVFDLPIAGVGEWNLK